MAASARRTSTTEARRPLLSEIGQSFYLMALMAVVVGAPLLLAMLAVAAVG